MKITQKQHKIVDELKVIHRAIETKVVEYGTPEYDVALNRYIELVSKATWHDLENVIPLELYNRTKHLFA